MTHRRLVFPALFAAHGGAVALALAGTPSSSAPPVATIAAYQIAAPLPPLLAVTQPAETPVTVAADAPVVEIVAEAPVGAAAPGCALAGTVQAALRGDSGVLNALDAIPHSARSVAGAVMLWDGHWATSAALGGPGALEPIRARVRASILAASAECRDAAVDGPRLMFVADGADTVVLAVGSGRWAWSQLLENKQDI